MLRFGKICKIDVNKGFYKVDLDEDDIETGWLPRILTNTKDNRDEAHFDIGEHVACVMDEHIENGVILGAINSDENEPPVKNKDKRRTTYKDGSYVEFDRSTGVWDVNVKGNAKITTNQKLIINSTSDTEITCTKLKVTGDVDITGKVDATGNIKSSTGDIQATVGDVKAGVLNISLQLHKHGGVTTGTSSTGPAIP